MYSHSTYAICLVPACLRIKEPHCVLGYKHKNLQEVVILLWNVFIDRLSVQAMIKIVGNIVVVLYSCQWNVFIDRLSLQAMIMCGRLHLFRIHVTGICLLAGCLYNVSLFFF